MLLISLVNVVNAETLTGKVVGVSDGDTITVLAAGKKQVHVRLAQIDAPEKKQDFGQAVKKALSRAVFNRDVVVEVMDTDRYHRKVGKVWAGGADVSLGQIQSGMAWVYRKYAKDQAYYAAEDTAKAAKVGLWSKPNPVPPWEFRHNGNKSSNKSKLTNIATWVWQRFTHSLKIMERSDSGVKIFSPQKRCSACVFTEAFCVVKMQAFPISRRVTCDLD